MSKLDLFLELACPNDNGFSRWVSVSEFVGKYETLRFGNGGSWCRRNSSLYKKFDVIVCKTLTRGNSIDAIKLNGYQKNDVFNQTIRKDIRDELKDRKCVFTGVYGNSENTIIEIDHKNGQKKDLRISDVKTQTIDDFQPTIKAMNDIKRNICGRCIRSDKRPSAKQIEGYPCDYVCGNEKLSESGCVGCFWYDPVFFRKEAFARVQKGIIKLMNN